MGRPSALVRAKAGNIALSDFLNRHTISERMYFGAMARGYSEQEAFKIVKALGIDMAGSLLKPEFQETLEVMRNGRWYKAQEAHDYWLKMLCETFEELVMMRGIEEMMERDPTSIDKDLVRECTKVVGAHMGRHYKMKEGKKAELPGEYDRMVLERYRVGNEDGPEQIESGN